MKAVDAVERESHQMAHVRRQSLGERWHEIATVSLAALGCDHQPCPRGSDKNLTSDPTRTIQRELILEAWEEPLHVRNCDSCWSCVCGQLQDTRLIVCVSEHSGLVWDVWSFVSLYSISQKQARHGFDHVFEMTDT
jgi:hypothetical protein